jgi:hypothetical protein
MRARTVIGALAVATPGFPSVAAARKACGAALFEAALAVQPEGSQRVTDITHPLCTGCDRGREPRARQGVWAQNLMAGRRRAWPWECAAPLPWHST